MYTIGSRDDSLKKLFQDKWRNTSVSLLHLAAVHGWVEIVIDLITKHKCETNCKDSRGRTPLLYAASNNHLEVVRYFINEQHCDSMTRDKNGDTLLYIACRNGHLNIAKYLINEEHCSPSCENNDGDTPLHFACCYGHTHIVQYLLSIGKVDPMAKNKNGSILVEYASIQDNSYDLLKLFQSFPQCEKRLSRAHIHKTHPNWIQWSWQDHHISTHSPLSQQT